MTKMIKRTIVLSCALAVAVLSGAPTAHADEFERLLGLMDTSRLGPVQDIQIPAESLAYDARQSLRPSSAGPALAHEQLQLFAQTPESIYAHSAGFTYELRKRRSGFQLLRKEGPPPGDPVPGGGSELLVDALDRLVDLGLPVGELDPLDSRLLLVKEQNLEGQIEPPKIVGFKQFIDRTLAGIPILGSRAVVTYEKGRRFGKALVYWPSLAPQGHLLTSEMSPGEVAEVVVNELIASGETDVTGSIPLRWVYDTMTDSNGRVLLALRVEATLLEPETPLEDGEVEKTRARLFALPR